MKLLNLKAHSILFNILVVIVASSTLTLTSCGRDGLTESIAPNPIHQIDLAASVVSTEVTFEFGLHLNKINPDCPKILIQYDVQHDAEDWSSHKPGCPGPLTQKADPGQGWNLEFGRFLTEIEFLVNPIETLFTGSIELIFPADDALLYTLSNTYQLQMEKDSTLTLIVDIQEVQGIGVFTEIDFEGTLYIMDAQQIFAREITDYNVTVKIVGTIAKQ